MLNIAIAGGVTWISSLLMALFVYTNKPSTAAKKVWSLFCLLVSFFGYCVMIGWSLGDPQQAWAWCYLLNLYVVFIPVVFFHFTTLLTGISDEKKYELAAYYIISAVYFCSALLFPRAYIADVTYRQVLDYYTLAGPLYYGYPVLYGFFTFYGLWILYQSYETADERDQIQYSYIFVSMAISFLGGWTTLPLLFDIEIYPHGMWLIPLHVFIITYAILKHRLMDIRVFIKRSLIYTIHVSTISLLYVACIFLVHQWAQSVFGYESFVESLIAILIIAFALAPLKYLVQNIVEHFLFKGTFLEMAEQNLRLRKNAFQLNRYRNISNLTKKFIDDIKGSLVTLNRYKEYLDHNLDDKNFQERFVKDFEKQTNNMENLIEQFHFFNEHKVPTLTKTDFVHLLDRAVHKLRGEFKKNKIEVFKYYDTDKSLLLDVDPSQMSQAFLNILINSKQAMGEGGQIWIGLEKDTKNVEVSIKDTGPGIPEDKLTNIFNPNFLTKDSGVGLTITKSIIEHHNGSVNIESEEGVGTEIIIRLPVHA